MEKQKITTSDVFDAFSVKLLDEERCREFLLKLLHTGVASCPFCKSKLTRYNQEKFWKNEQCYCSFCGKKFFGVTKTILSSKKLSWSQIVLFCLFAEMDLKTGQIAKLINSERQSVSRWLRKLKAKDTRYAGKR